MDKLCCCRELRLGALRQLLFDGDKLDDDELDDDELDDDELDDDELDDDELDDDVFDDDEFDDDEVDEDELNDDGLFLDERLGERWERRLDLDLFRDGLHGNSSGSGRGALNSRG